AALLDLRREHARAQLDLLVTGVSIVRRAADDLARKNLRAYDVDAVVCAGNVLLELSRAEDHVVAPLLGLEARVDAADAANGLLDYLAVSLAEGAYGFGVRRHEHVGHVEAVDTDDLKL